jgi:glycosyltransferase involved in cell wall biosynthesis
VTKTETTNARRVVLAIGTLEIGGTEGQVTELALGLRRRGWEVRVVSLRLGGPYAQQLRDHDVDVHDGVLRDPARPRAWDALAAPVRLVRYVAWLRRARPDIVHAFLFAAYVPTVFAARLARVPTIISGRRSLGNFKRGRRTWLLVERAANACTDLVIANSEAVKHDVCTQERLAPEKVVVIHNGVDDRFFAVPERTPSARPKIACIANLIPYKGHADLVEAAALLTRDGVPFDLVLAGEGPCRAQLERQVRTLEAPVEFLGTCRDIVGLLSTTDIVVSASHEEGFSNSLLEAMAAGRAIVATDVGGNAELLGDTAVLVAPHDPAAIHRALHALLDDEERRRDLGTRARARAKKEFTMEKMLDAHVELYERMAG